MASQRHVRWAGGFAWLMVLGATGGASGQGFEIGNYRIVSQTRVDRTVFAYTMRADLTNGVLAAQGVRATLRIEGAPQTTVVEGTLDFGDLAQGEAAASLDTFTIRHDRLVPFDPAVFRWTFSVASMPLDIAIDSPVSGFLTNGTNVIVTGTVGAAVDAVEVNGVRAVLNQGRFAAEVFVREGRNTLSAVAGNAFGGSGTAAVTVNRDTHPPTLNIETPADGVILASRQTTVSGMVNDIVPGTVNPEQALVMVNGLPATVLNRSYSIPDLLLVPGRNVIEVTAIDRAGNAARHQIQVTVQDSANQKRLVKLAGDMQTGMIGSGLADPLVVELVDGNGVAQTNQPVTFSICRNDGQLFAPPEQGRSLTLQTDDRGQAQVLFRLGTRTGAGNNQVDVTAAGALGQLIFCANATGAPPHRVAALLPETQVGEPGKPLAQPWTAYVTDIGGNPAGGAPINFMVFQGGGTINGVTMLTTNTDSDGRASVIQTLGPDDGINNNVVIAVVPGLTNGAATFVSTARTPQRPELTRLVGLVLDNANRPLSNILCHIEGTHLETVTDAQGQFVISNAPVGSVRLFVDARKRGHPGTWHPLEFDLVTVAGRDNSVDRPIYMLPLDEGKLAGGDQPVTVNMKGIPGAQMTIFPHSIRDPEGRPVVTNVSFSEVNLERVPMPPPLGSQFMLAWTVQPPGLHFDPPARMCIPNMGAPPGQVVEMFSFDHDLIQFVAIGTATITADGALMCSDPGFGVTKSGWGGCVPPPPPCTPVCSPKPADTPCATYQTIPPSGPCACPTYTKVNKPDGTPCMDDGKDCTDDKCMGGACTHMPKMPTGPACMTAMVATSFPEHLNSGHQVVPATAFASTLPHYADTKVETTACLDGNTFRIRVTSAVSPVDIDEHATLQGRMDCDTVVLTAANYCMVVDDLDDQDYSNIPCISKACNLAHERAHKKEWEDNWNARFPMLKMQIEALSIAASDEICTPDKAKDKLKMQIDNLVNAAVAAGRMQWNGEGEGVNGEAAEDACNAGKIMGICAQATMMGFPACALCPP